MKNLGIYIHIPFCESKCHYCDFTSGVGSKDRIAKYSDAIINEIKGFDKCDYVVDTIFIGGGTPTSLNVGVLSDIITAIKSTFEISLKEFTIEGNPNSYTEEKLAEYKALGVTRVSVGVQSFEDKVLKSIGRIHTGEDAKSCVKMLAASGLCVSADLMVGLPDQTIDMAVRDAAWLVDSGITHVSCYSLILESGTKLHAMVKNGQVALPTEDQAVDMYDGVMQVLESGGLNRYEVSNFGAPCEHNLGYWRLKDYAGFGVSAHSLIDGVRYYNTDNIAEYIKGSDYIIDEKLTIDELAAEYVMLALRLDCGINTSEYKDQFGQQAFDNMQIIASEQSQYLDISTHFIKIKREFSYISNSIIEKFI